MSVTLPLTIKESIVTALISSYLYIQKTILINATLNSIIDYSLISDKINMNLMWRKVKILYLCSVLFLNAFYIN